MIHLGDITKIHGDQIEPVDCITFGSPCQDLSMAGLRAGLEGKNSGLFTEAIGIRIVQDKGAAIQGKHLDVAVDTHENAEKWNGCGNHRVWVLKEE